MDVEFPKIDGVDVVAAKPPPNIDDELFVVVEVTVLVAPNSVEVLVGGGGGGGASEAADTADSNSDDPGVLEEPNSDVLVGVWDADDTAVGAKMDAPGVLKREVVALEVAAYVF